MRLGAVPPMLVLARWLGPWARGAPQVATREVVIGDARAIRVRHYGAGAPLVIAPGLHVNGPDDPRLDRFCRVLAASGHEVIAPFLPDHVRLMPGTRACADFARVIDARVRRPATIFSISLGSRLAVHAAAVRPDAVARLVVFGGYAAIAPTLTYGLTGAVDGIVRARRDPITHAIVAINVLDAPPAVIAALRSFVARATLEPPAAIAAELRAALPAELRSTFDDGVGIDAPSARVLAAIATTPPLVAELDGAADCARVRCPVDIIHGRDDGDVPVEQAHALAKLLIASPRVGVHVLDDYHHTGFSRARLRGLAGQARTLLRVLVALAPAS